MRAAAILSLCSFDRQVKNLTFSINFLFSSYSKVMISSTALRKVSRSIPHRLHVSQALTEAALGALQSKASSPKPSPTRSCFLTFQFVMICIIPFSMMKKQSALLPSLKMYWSVGTEQQNIFLATFSSSASERLQKMKWFFRQPRMNDISWYFFYFFQIRNYSSQSSLGLSLSSLDSQNSSSLSSQLSISKFLQLNLNENVCEEIKIRGSKCLILINFLNCYFCKLYFLRKLILFNMENQNTDYKIPSLSQVHEELVKSKIALKHVLDSIDFSPLDLANSNYSNVCGKGSIESVMQSIPPEPTLTNMVNQASKQFKTDCINNYAGDYKLVKQLQQHLDNAKSQAVDTYFLITQVKPQHLNSATEYIKENGKLHSCNIYGQQQKVSKYEKNALHHRYRHQLKQKENIRLISVPQAQLLSENQLMVHVTFYDSHISQKQNEFICYGRQLLTQLRDKFYCLIQQLQSSKSRSSFIFIDNIFYNDLRYTNHNLSQEITSKARSSQVSYISLPMQKTYIHDLRIEVGKPYVFRHLEGCDHMIVFNEVRLLDGSLDLMDVKAYPVNVYEKRLKRRKCEGCDQRFAALIVLDDKMKNGEHGYYCEKCHMDLHLDPEGEPKYKGMIVIKYLHD